MKKLLFLSLIAGALISTANAQGPSPKQQPNVQQPVVQPPTSDQMAKMLKEAKEKQKPLMIEKTGLTDAQADRVIEINFEIRQMAATTLQGLNDADRSAKIAELKVTKEKKYSEIPLTADQIKAVYAFYEDMGKNPPKRD